MRNKLTLICSAVAILFAGFFVLKLIPNAREKETKGKGVNFIDNSWPQALKLAAEQKKYIFVDAYATWCGPCKLMRITTFKNGKAGEFFNQHFVNVAIDMEKGDGPTLAQAWGINAYPTLIICNAEGKPVYGSVGYIGAKDLIRFGEAGLTK